jgi:hypothetical protein
VSLLARAVSAAPDVALGGLFLVTWIDPRVFGGGVLKYAMLMMLMEFIVVHSAGFMSLVLWGSSLGVVKKTLATLGLGVFYTTFLAALTYGAEAWWPVWAFWGLTVNRLTNALLSQKGGKQGRANVANDWVTSGVLYIFWVIGTSILWIPALGITPAVAASAALPGMGGLWVEQPYRVVVAGAGYFLSQACCELRGAGVFGARRS